MPATFVRGEALAELRRHLVRYLSPGGLLETESSLLCSLTGLDADELDQLSAAHLLMDPTTAGVAESLPILVRQLPSSSALTSHELQGAVRGQVRWSSTMQRRWHAGNPTLFVCAMPERRYDTNQGRLLKATIAGLNDAVRRTRWQNAMKRQSSPTRERPDQAITRVQHVDAHVGSLADHPKLRDVRRVELGTELLSNLRTRSALAATCDVYERYRQLLVDRDPTALLNALSARYLAPDQDRLFELLVGFRLTDIFKSQGWKVARTQRLLGSRTPLAHLRRGDETLVVWWQQSVFRTFAAHREGVVGGNLRMVQKTAGARTAAYRPDLLLEFHRDDGARRVAIGEVKLTQSERSNTEADGVRDVFAYLHDAEPLARRIPVTAFVVAWDAAGSPAPGRVIVSDQRQLARLAALVADGSPGRTDAST